MIIYLEDLADHGLTVVDLEQSPERWEELRVRVLERALSGLRVASSAP